jgi:accessory colonization factor AcfC
MELMKAYEEVINRDRNDDDVTAFNKAIGECYKLFKQRREQYGKHTDDDIEYTEWGLALKAMRYIRKMKKNDEIDRDTMVDLACYALMWLSMVYVDDDDE